MIQITKRDLIWSYGAQFFSIASGIIILPLLLRLLTPEEIGMNYIMLSIASLVQLVDFGFSPQFSRNITYVYSGIQRLLKEGIEHVDGNKRITINYRLLATLIQTSTWIYKIIAFIVLLLMLTAGTAYVYYITLGFTNIKHSLLIWLIFSLSTFFNIYYSYYNALLMGAGQIMESKKAMIYSSIFKIGLSYILLVVGLGLVGVVLANFISPFLNRILSYKYYFTIKLKSFISPYLITLQEKKELFWIIWYNSKKMGLCGLSRYLSIGATTIIAGIFLPLTDIASYGLMTQLLGIISAFSYIIIATIGPRLAALQIGKNQTEFIKELAWGMVTLYILFVIGSIGLILLGSHFLSIIGSHTTLPNIYIIIVASIFTLLDQNYYNLLHVIIIKNEFYFIKSQIITAIAGILILIFVMKFITASILIIILSIGLTQTFFNNWYWPKHILKNLNLTGINFLSIGLGQIRKRVFLR